MQIFFQNNFPRLSDNDTAEIIDQYPLQEESLPEHKAWYPSASMAYGDAVFICPTVTVLDAIAASANSTTDDGGDSSSSSSSNAAAAPRADIFAYRYNVKDDSNTEKGLGVPHIFEAAAVFGPHSIGAFSDSYQTYNAPIIPIVMDYWISFVRALDPNPFRNEDAPAWDPWVPGTGTGDGDGDGNNGTAAGSEARQEEATTTSSSSSTSTTSSSSSSPTARRRLLFELDNTRMEEVPDSLMDKCDFWSTLGTTMEQKKRSAKRRSMESDWRRATGGER